ncbi:MAG: class I SAM-dependent methyltransferase [Alphaproteobacteria bacterium]|nr:class I SAM-dependent methyltransferase [Alphaproteobacteria bacterium]
MERGEYERLAAVEDRMWWTRALRRNLRAAAAPFAGTPDGRLLDAGCGTGGLLATLAHPASFGLDRDGFACRLARTKARRPVAQGSVGDLPFDDAAFEIIVSADVLCHRGVGVERALGEMHRCLKPGGALIVNLPAYPWLYSAHDRAVDNARRFYRREVIGLLAAAGFGSIRATYWNTLLFPLMVARRLLPGGGSEVGLLPASLEWLFDAVATFESALLRSGLRLPFGGSILAVGTRR